jgi:PKD repeat protein/uncharacterized protein (DUF2141 family)
MIIIISCLFLSSQMRAQVYLEVTENGWGGGLSYAKPAIADIDGDGLMDMLVGDEYGKIHHFEQGVVGDTSFYKISNNFNNIDVGAHAAPTFTDIDGDGLLDLIIGKEDGYLVHYEQNEVNDENFTLITNTFNNIDVGDHAAPVFKDIDGDDLLDLLIGEYSGNLNHYEQNNPNSNLFSSITSSFNGIDIGYYSTPSFTDLNGDGLLDLFVGEDNGRLNHYFQQEADSYDFTSDNLFSYLDVGSYSSPLFTDLDNDNFIDLVIGNSAGEVQLFEQSETPDYDNFYQVTSNFNGIDVGNYSKPMVYDIDGDGLLDMLIGAESGNIQHYIQSAESPDIFYLINSNFNAIDVGDNSAPYLGDIDGDGLQDLLIGNYSGTIFHYEQALEGSLIFTLVTENFNDIDVGSESIPCFEDIDNDGLLELLIGESNGNLNQYEQSDINSYNFTVISSYFEGIDVGGDSSPTIFDIDNDGLYDLFIGESVGNLNLHEQLYADSLYFELITSSFLNIDVGSSSVPFIGDFNNDGITDLLIGESNGNINHYRQYDQYNSFSQISNSVCKGVNLFGENTKPCFADINNNGLMDLLIGNYSGILWHYEQSPTDSLVYELISENFNDIDVGAGSSPAITDFDNDGLLDLLIGESDGIVNYYEQESAGSYVFNLQVEALSGIDIGNSAIPFITDLNGDGFFDLLIGESEGNINHYEQSDQNPLIFVEVTSTFNSIDVGNNSTPFVSDINNDGLLDLLIGESSGNINHFVQDDINSTNFSQVTTNYGDIDVGANSAPFVLDMNSDGANDLVVGEAAGGLHLYLDYGTSCTQLITPVNDTTEMDLLPTFTWVSAPNADGYYLNLGTDNPPTNFYYRQDMGADTSFTLTEPLEYNQSYYWTIEPYNAVDTAAGCEVYSFTTQTLIEIPDIETFADCVFPSGWNQETLSGEPDIWASSNTANAGGEPCELLASPVTGNGTSRLITPMVNTAGLSELGMEFDHYFEDAGSFGLVIFIESSSDGINWTSEGWNIISGTGNIGPEKAAVSITNNLGDKTYVAFTLSDNHNNFVSWSIDNVGLFDATLPPVCATPVAPENEATEVSLLTSLSCNPTANTNGYKLYFGTDNPPTNIENGTDLEEVTEYVPTDVLEQGITYYWQVVPYNVNGDAEACELWSFETKTLIPPTSLEAVFNSPNVELTWSEPVIIGDSILVVDLDENTNSAPSMVEILNNLEFNVRYENSFPATLTYTAIFVCLGIYADNMVLTEEQGQLLANYLDSGGNLYMEGGDTWYFDDPTAVHSMFGLSGTSDGSGDLGTINGVSGTFTEGMSYNYSGENNYIDHLEATEGEVILNNISPAYGTAVAYDAGTYKTIGASHEFGGLSDGNYPSTKENLLLSYLEFFGISVPTKGGRSSESYLYNAYRNDTLLNPEPIDTTWFLDESVSPGLQSYTVKAVYEDGLSEPAGPVEVVIPYSEPTIYADPLSFTYDAISGELIEDTLTISNLGDGELVYGIVVEFPAKTKELINASTVTLDWENQFDLGHGAKTDVTPNDAEVDAQNLTERRVAEGFPLSIAKTANPTPSPNQTDNEVIRYDNGVNNDAIGLTAGGTFEVSAYWPAATMSQYSGMWLTEVEVYINNLPDSFVLKIYDAGTITVPGALLHEETVSVTANSWNVIELSQPLDIKGDDIWIGYEVTHAAGEFVAGCDAGPAVAGFGDMISLDGITFEPMSGLGLDYNWNIASTLFEPQFTNDVGVAAISSPNSGADLTNAEPVTFTIKNYGIDAQSDIDWEITWDGPTGTQTVSGTLSGPLGSDETNDITLTETTDLSLKGVYLFEACASIEGDENPLNDCRSKVVIHQKENLGWLTILPETGSLDFQNALNHQLTVNVPEEDGSYTANINISSNDPNNPQIIIPVELNVIVPLQANFAADTLIGQLPLTVQFSDSTIGTNPPTSWEWDFQNDGITDSYEQNPEWTYNDIGSYSVKLTVSNGEESSEMLKENYIEVNVGEYSGPVWYVDTTGNDLFGNGSEDYPFATIQHGIDVSTEGDTVLVIPGTYYENIDFIGKNIVVGSQHLFGNDTSFISQTIIYGVSDNEAVVNFTNGESTEAVFYGFSITGGSYRGVYIDNADPSIKYLKVFNNNIINEVGAGIYIYSSGSSLIQCEIFNNNCTGSVGGGLYIWSYSGNFFNNKIFDNSADAGGGIYITDSPFANIESNFIYYNHASMNGGGMYFNASNTILQHNLIAFNSTDDPQGGGAGIRINASDPTLKNNTIAYNQGMNGGGIRIGFSSDPQLINNIVWGNAASLLGNQIKLDDDNSDPDFYYCDIEGGIDDFGYEVGVTFDGAYENCIDEDPLFNDSDNNDFSLTEDSPCIDAGDPSQPDDPDLSISDMGYLYYHQDFVAAFEADQTWVFPMQEVQFNDLSTGSPTSWEWDLNGDGTIDSYDQNPSWVYPDFGNYSVSLSTANASNDDTRTKMDYIKVDYLPKSVITSIEDVPDDQGGKLYVNFSRSFYDTDSLQDWPAMYSVEMNTGYGWVNTATVGAYGADYYSAICITPFDSSQYGNGLIDFRVIALMEEGNFASEVAQGYSVDNLAPAVPDGMTYELLANNIDINWQPSPDFDFAYFAIYKSDVSGEFPETPVATTTQPNFNEQIEQGEVAYYVVTAYDHHGNESEHSEEIETVPSMRWDLPQGWSGISSYIEPQDSNIETLFADIAPEMIILQNDNGMYWPGQNITP